MPARDARAPGQRQRPLQQRGAALLLEARAGQEAPPGGRGEGHRRLELGVVAPAGALPGVRPVVVEDVLALAVPLGIERHHRDRHALGAGDEVARHPAAAAADRARGLERREEAVGGEGVDGRPAPVGLGVPGAGVPVGRGDLAEAAEDRDLDAAAAVHCSPEMAEIGVASMPPASRQRHQPGGDLDGEARPGRGIGESREPCRIRDAGEAAPRAPTRRRRARGASRRT